MNEVKKNLDEARAIIAQQTAHHGNSAAFAALDRLEKAVSALYAAAVGEVPAPAAGQ